MDFSVELRIICIFVVFAVSSIGFFLPWILRLYYSNIIPSEPFFLLKCFSSGTILGVAMLHLLVDAIEDLSSQSEYPIALALSCIGIALTLTFEQSCHMYVERSYDLRVKADTHTCQENTYDTVAQVGNEAITIKNIDPEKETELNNNKQLIKAIVLESSVAVHSIILGFGVGTLTEVGTLEIVIIAFSFHQFFEGIGLGTAMIETNLNEQTKLFFGLLFSLTMPVGIVLGLLNSKHNSPTIQGCANAIASGTLIYSALVEMVSEDFSHHNDNCCTLKNRYIKVQMSCAFSLGLLFMAIIAIYG